MANPAFVAAGTSAGGTSTSREVETPAGGQVGHLLLAEIMIDGAEVTLTMSGWTKIGQAHSTTGEPQTTAWFWKVATEAGAKKHKVEWGGASRYNAGMIGVFKGVNASSPIAAFASKLCEPKSLSMVFASIAPAMASCMSVLFGGIDNTGTGTPPEGWTERQDNTVGNYLATKAEITAGATGEKTVTTSAERVFVTAHIALAPEPSGPARGSLSLLGVGK
jgi:hypothetical protein